MNAARKELIIQREKALHDRKTRSDTSLLENLLHPSFKEVGYSGKTWDFKLIVGLLQNQANTSSVIQRRTLSAIFSKLQCV